MAQHRPWVPVLVLTPSVNVACRLMLSYAIYPVMVPNVDSFKEAVELATRVAVDHGLAHAGDRLVMTAGVPFGKAGTTNIVRVVEV
jgi:pyruvate kinase